MTRRLCPGSPQTMNPAKLLPCHLHFVLREFSFEGRPRCGFSRAPGNTPRRGHHRGPCARGPAARHARRGASHGCLGPGAPPVASEAGSLVSGGLSARTPDVGPAHCCRRSPLPGGLEHYSLQGGSAQNRRVTAGLGWRIRAKSARLNAAPESGSSVTRRAVTGKPPWSPHAAVVSSGSPQKLACSLAQSPRVLCTERRQAATFCLSRPALLVSGGGFICFSDFLKLHFAVSDAAQ